MSTSQKSASSKPPSGKDALERIDVVGKARKRYRPFARQLVKRHGTDAVLDVKHEDVPVAYVERGNFSHAVCAFCSWEGPGRRARDKARRDAQEHTETCKKAKAKLVAR